MPSVELSANSIRTLQLFQERLSFTKSRNVTLDDAIEFLRWNYELKKNFTVTGKGYDR